MKSSSHSFRPAALAALLVSAVAPALSGQTPPVADDKAGVFRGSLTIDREPLERGGAILKSYADMLEKRQPSVVTILTGVAQPQRRRISREEQLWRQFYGIPPAPEPKPGEERWQQLGIGSGVIVSANGYILTNKHVVFPPDMSRMDPQEYLDLLRLR